MKAAYRIFKNTAIMFSANIVKKIITFVLILVIARYLGVANYGKLSFALSFVALFSIFSDFGAKVLINREIARNKSNVNKYVSNVIITKIVLSCLMLVIVGVMAVLLSYPKDTINLVYIAAFIIIFQSLGEPLGSAFRGFEEMKYNAVSLIGSALARLILSLIVVFLKLGVKELLYMYLISEIFGFLLELVFYHFNIHKFYLEWDLKFSKTIIVGSIPFGMAALLMNLYDKIDVTMLSKMVVNSDTVIGWYSAAYNFMFIFEFIPMSIGAAVYSYTSIAYLNAIERFKYVYRKITYYYFCLTIPLAFGTVAIADKLVGLLYGGEYIPSVIALQILIWSVIFKFQMYGMGTILNSMNKEKLTLKATVVSLITNVVLNLILIPKYTYIGASIATVAAELAYFMICFMYLNRNLEHISLSKTLYKSILASILMFVIAYYLKFVNLGLSIIVAIAVYSAAMYFLRAIPKEDVKYSLKVVRESAKKWKLPISQKIRI